MCMYTMYTRVYMIFIRIWFTLVYTIHLLVYYDFEFMAYMYIRIGVLYTYLRCMLHLYILY